MERKKKKNLSLVDDIPRVMQETMSSVETFFGRPPSPPPIYFVFSGSRPRFDGMYQAVHSHGYGNRTYKPSPAHTPRTGYYVRDAYGRYFFRSTQAEHKSNPGNLNRSVDDGIKECYSGENHLKESNPYKDDYYNQNIRKESIVTSIEEIIEGGSERSKQPIVELVEEEIKEHQYYTTTAQIEEVEEYPDPPLYAPADNKKEPLVEDKHAVAEKTKIQMNKKRLKEIDKKPKVKNPEQKKMEVTLLSQEIRSDSCRLHFHLKSHQRDLSQ
jgi:hypothetical protein